MVLDRNLSKIVLMVSKEGGTEIEEVAAKTPEKIIKEVIDPYIGLTTFQGRRLAQALELPAESISQAVDLFQKLYQLYIDKDCTIVEINPLVLTESHDLLALDVKLNFDGNALYRHKDIVALRDLSEEDEREVEASAYDLSYVALDGQIGCMVNGAGLAMATMDIIKQYGGSPANFLDVGGSATVEKVREAFKIICSDEQVKGIFINIFGGIMKCDVIAEGVVQAAEALDIKLPLVVRLEGTNVEKGRAILDKSDLNITASETMADGAYKVVALTK
jgi:succinyl-CoA synthetase beta subunit